MIIQSTQKLDEVCQRFAKYPFITVDTEFIREKTYYPVLCLIQIASPQEAFCIDPLIPELDLSPLFQLFQNEDVVKVFHASRQDIEIFYHLSNHIPKPLFDTQVAAMVCGYPENIAYQRLVQEITGVQLDKGMRYTDWQRRPLNDKQLSYALCDVTYLRDVYTYLKQELLSSNREQWFQEEMMPLRDVRHYVVEPNTAWEKIKCPFHQKKSIQVFVQLCTWREMTARHKNRPRRHILKDEALLELAAICPTSVHTLNQMRSIPDGFTSSKEGAEVLALIHDVIHHPENYPDTFSHTEHKGLTPEQKSLANLYRLLIDTVAEQQRIAPKILATHDDIQDLVLEKKETRCLNGWRREIIGAQILALRAGELVFRYDPKQKGIQLLRLNEHERAGVIL